MRHSAVRSGAGVARPAGKSAMGNGNAGGDPDRRGERWGSSAAPRACPRARKDARGRIARLRRSRSVGAAAVRPRLRRDGERALRIPDLPTPTSRPLPLLDRDEIAALALTLGILCFAVVTRPILFVAHAPALGRRSRRRRATRRSPPTARGRRAYALFLSEPQILGAWHGGRRRARNHRRSHAGEPGRCQACSPSLAKPTPPPRATHPMACMHVTGGVRLKPATEGEHRWHPPGSPAWDRR